MGKKFLKNRGGTARDWLYPRRKDRDGNKLCCWCSSPLSGRKQSWCGQDCVDEYRVVKSDQNHLRGIAWRKHRGVCQKCGVDTEELQREFREAISHAVKETKGRFRSMGFNTNCGTKYSGIVPSFWQADHKIPVAEGGNLLGVWNIQTLCVPCHKEKTKGQRKNKKSDKNS